jgi:CheY-like chemotaxis protein
MNRAAHSAESAVQAGDRRITAKEGRVLVVEDNTEIASGVADLVKLLGFEVAIATDGHQALAHARNVIPDIVLCDIGLPNGMDGFAVARAVKGEPTLRPVRLIAVTGYSRAEDYANAKAAGFEDLIPKPLTLESLRALLFPQ